MPNQALTFGAAATATRLLQDDRRGRVRRVADVELQSDETSPEAPEASPAEPASTTDVSEAGPTIGLRLLLALVGAALCAAGVVAGTPWLIGVGIAALVATSVIPDRSFSLPAGTARSRSADLSGATALLGGGTALVVISILGLFRRIDISWPLTTWLIGLGAVVAGSVYRDVSVGAWRPRMRPSVRSFDLWMLTALTIVGFVLRVRRLETLPPMHGDEGEMGMLALRVGSEEYLPPFTTGFLDHPTLYHYLQKVSMVIFGQSVGGLRMGSAIFGALCIPAVYVVGRLGWTRRVGLVAAAILTFSHIHIHFSRMALNNIHSVLMGIVMVGLLLWSDQALKSRSMAMTPLVSVGMVCGLAQYFYYGSRLLPVILGLGLVVMIWRYRTQFSRILLVPFGFFLAWLPIVPRYVEAPVTFASRQSGVNVFSELNAQAVGADGTWGILLVQVKRNLRFFVDSGDVSSFYFSGAPGLTAVAAILFWVGLGLALAKFTSFPNFVTVCWFVFGLVLGGILTNGSPAATRLVMIFPAIALFGGVAVDHFVTLAVKAPSVTAERVRSGLVVVLALVLAQGGISTYFQKFADDPPQGSVDLIGRDFAERVDSADTFLLGAPRLFAEHGTLRFISSPGEPRNLFDAVELADQANNKPELFVVALPEQKDELQRLSKQVPGGEHQTVEGSSGQLLYFSYLVDH